MKILVVYPDQLFPNTMASHDRVIEMVRCLALSHEVHVACLLASTDAWSRNEAGILELGAMPILIEQPFRSYVGRKVAGFAFLLASILTGIERHYFYTWNPLISLGLISLLRRESYDAIQVEFCYQATLLRHARPGTLKVIDTIDVLYEKRTKEARHHHGAMLPWQARRRLAVFKKMELERTALADMIISISKHDLDVFREHLPEHTHLLIPMGRRPTPGVATKKTEHSPAILFYGHMGSEQNQAGFWRFWDRIYPIVVQRMGGVRPPVLVVGTSPPESICRLHDGTNVTVTGFVQDVRPWFARAGVLCVPLDLAGGFRGRVLDALAAGIPVVGTHNALDCIAIKDGRHGFVADADESLAEGLALILRQPDLQARMGAACRALVNDVYSIEATYGQLRDFYRESGSSQPADKEFALA